LETLAVLATLLILLRLEVGAVAETAAAVHTPEPEVVMVVVADTPVVVAALAAIAAPEESITAVPDAVAVLVQAVAGAGLHITAAGYCKTLTPQRVVAELAYLGKVVMARAEQVVPARIV